MELSKRKKRYKQMTNEGEETGEDPRVGTLQDLWMVRGTVRYRRKY